MTNLAGGALGYELRALSTEAEWAVYHDIRRAVLFEARGRGSVYDADHPDERRAGHHPLLLFHDGTALGVIRIDIDDARAVFRRVAIREDVQRQGHGRALLAHAERFAHEHGCTRVESHVDPDAVGFYARCGFEPADRNHSGGSVFMAKALAR